MLKIKNIAAGLGLAAGFVALVAPMTTFADDLSGSDTLDVEVNVNTIISMRLVSTSAAGTKTTTCDSRNVVIDDNTGEVTSDSCTGDEQSVSTTILPSSADTTSMTTNIYVTTNSADGYSLTVIDSDTNNSLQNLAGDTISAISSLPAGGTNPGWAISSDNGTSWQAVPVSTASALVIKNYSPSPKALANDDQSTIRYGVAASETQATGTYTDTITYTATAH